MRRDQRLPHGHNTRTSSRHARPLAALRAGPGPGMRGRRRVRALGCVGGPSSKLGSRRRKKASGLLDCNYGGSGWPAQTRIGPAARPVTARCSGKRQAPVRPLLVLPFPSSLSKSSVCATAGAAWCCSGEGTMPCSSGYGLTAGRRPRAASCRHTAAPALPRITRQNSICCAFETCLI